VDATAIGQVAALLRTRNDIDAQLANIIGRPPLVGHLGEWIAAQVFDIQLEASASAKAIDGRFRSGQLAGRTVNIKMYGKREGLLDTSDDPSLDYYLVLCGPKSTAMTSRGGTRPFCVAAVYLFDAVVLRADQATRGIKSGVASSVRGALWDAAEVFPRQARSELTLTPEQADALVNFAPAGG
jgi:hypothetical protein